MLRLRPRLNMTNKKTKNVGIESYELETKDCIMGMSEMAEASVDIVVTSPPYNLGIKYRNIP